MNTANLKSSLKEQYHGRYHDFGQNSLYLNFERCLNFFLNRLLKVILGRKVEPKYSTSGGFSCVTTVKLENVGPAFSNLTPFLFWSSAGENIRG